MREFPKQFFQIHIVLSRPILYCPLFQIHIVLSVVPDQYCLVRPILSCPCKTFHSCCFLCQSALQDFPLSQFVFAHKCGLALTQIFLFPFYKSEGSHFRRSTPSPRCGSFQMFSPKTGRILRIIWLSKFLTTPTNCKMYIY